MLALASCKILFLPQLAWPFCIAFIRGFTRHNSKTLGNFWFDLTRSTALHFVAAFAGIGVALVWQGVPQTFSQTRTVSIVQPQEVTDATTKQTTKITEQSIPVGPVASQIAIKQLGTNGGGFCNVNSAHPL